MLESHELEHSALKGATQKNRGFPSSYEFRNHMSLSQYQFVLLQVKIASSSKNCLQIDNQKKKLNVEENN